MARIDDAVSRILTKKFERGGSDSASPRLASTSACDGSNGANNPLRVGHP